MKRLRNIIIIIIICISLIPIMVCAVGTDYDNFMAGKIVDTGNVRLNNFDDTKGSAVSPIIVNDTLAVAPFYISSGVAYPVIETGKGQVLTFAGTNTCIQYINKSANDFVDQRLITFDFNIVAETGDQLSISFDTFDSNNVRLQDAVTFSLRKGSLVTVSNYKDKSGTTTNFPNIFTSAYTVNEWNTAKLFLDAINGKFTLFINDKKIDEVPITTLGGKPISYFSNFKITSINPSKYYLDNLGIYNVREILTAPTIKFKKFDASDTDYASNIPLTVDHNKIELTFSENIKPYVFISGDIKLNDQNVSGASVSGNKVSIPIPKLEYSTNYRLVIRDDIIKSSVSSKVLNYGYYIDYSTVSNTVFSQDSIKIFTDNIEETNNGSINRNANKIVIAFLNPVSLNPNLGTTDITFDGNTITPVISGNNVIFDLPKLARGHNYKLIVSIGSIFDGSYNAANEINYSFTTESNLPFKILTAQIGNSILGSNGITINIPISSKTIILKFEKEIDKFDKTKIKLKNNSGQLTFEDITFNSDTMTITLTDNLLLDSLYTLTLDFDAVMDKNENVIGNDSSYSFKTLANVPITIRKLYFSDGVNELNGNNPPLPNVGIKVGTKMIKLVFPQNIESKDTLYTVIGDTATFDVSIVEKSKNYTFTIPEKTFFDSNGNYNLETIISYSGEITSNDSTNPIVRLNDFNNINIDGTEITSANLYDLTLNKSSGSFAGYKIDANNSALKLSNGDGNTYFQAATLGYNTSKTAVEFEFKPNSVNDEVAVVLSGSTDPYGDYTNNATIVDLRFKNNISTFRYRKTGNTNSSLTVATTKPYLPTEFTKVKIVLDWQMRETEVFVNDSSMGKFNISITNDKGADTVGYYISRISANCMSSYVLIDNYKLNELFDTLTLDNVDFDNFMASPSSLWNLPVNTKTMTLEFQQILSASVIFGNESVYLKETIGSKTSNLDIPAKNLIISENKLNIILPTLKNDAQYKLKIKDGLIKSSNLKLEDNFTYDFETVKNNLTIILPQIKSDTTNNNFSAVVYNPTNQSKNILILMINKTGNKIVSIKTKIVSVNAQNAVNIDFTGENIAETKVTYMVLEGDTVNNIKLLSKPITR